MTHLEIIIQCISLFIVCFLSHYLSIITFISLITIFINLSIYLSVFAYLPTHTHTRIYALTNIFINTSTFIHSPYQPSYTYVGDLCFLFTESGRIAANHKIPILLTANNPDLNATEYKSPASQNTSFLLFGTTYRTFSELVSTYLSNGLQTVANTEGSNYKKKCFGTAQILSTRGANVSVQMA